MFNELQIRTVSDLSMGSQFMMSQLNSITEAFVATSIFQTPH